MPPELSEAVRDIDTVVSPPSTEMLLDSCAESEDQPRALILGRSSLQ